MSLLRLSARPMSCGPALSMRFAGASVAARRLHTSTVTKAEATSKVEEPIPAPKVVDRFHGSYHWDYERLLALSMIPLTASVAIQGSGNPTTDLLIGVILPLHINVGFEACVTDYLPKRKFGAVNTASIWAVRLLTAGALYGCYEFNTNDVGLTELVKKMWTA